MGDLQVIFDGKGEVSQWRGNPIYLDQTIEEGNFLDDIVINEIVMLCGTQFLFFYPNL